MVTTGNLSRYRRAVVSGPTISPGWHVDRPNRARYGRDDHDAGKSLLMEIGVVGRDDDLGSLLVSSR